MDDLKAEFEKSSDYRRRLQILTLSPFSLERTAEFFDTTIYMVKKSRKIKEDEGILPQVGRVSRGKKVSAADKLKVIEFYESDTVSRMCPGAKDYVVVRDEEGRKTKVQKRLILGNLKEIYQLFKEDKTNLEIGFFHFRSAETKTLCIGGQQWNPQCLRVHVSPECEAHGGGSRNPCISIQRSLGLCRMRCH